MKKKITFILYRFVFTIIFSIPLTIVAFGDDIFGDISLNRSLEHDSFYYKIELLYDYLPDFLAVFGFILLVVVSYEIIIFIEKKCVRLIKRINKRISKFVIILLISLLTIFILISVVIFNFKIDETIVMDNKKIYLINNRRIFGEYNIIMKKRFSPFFKTHKIYANGEPISFTANSDYFIISDQDDSPELLVFNIDDFSLRKYQFDESVTGLGCVSGIQIIDNHIYVSREFGDEYIIDLTNLDIVKTGNFGYGFFKIQNSSNIYYWKYVENSNSRLYQLIGDQAIEIKNEEERKKIKSNAIPHNEYRSY